MFFRGPSEAELLRKELEELKNLLKRKEEEEEERRKLDQARKEEQKALEEQERINQENEENKNKDYDAVVHINNLRLLEGEGWPVSYPRAAALGLSHVMIPGKEEKEKEEERKENNVDGKDQPVWGIPQAIADSDAVYAEELQLEELRKHQEKETIEIRKDDVPLPDHILAYQKEESLFVGVLGLYNKGKTHVMNRIAGTCVGEGAVVQTEGISFVKPCNERGEKLMLVDIAGFNSPVAVVDDNSIAEKYSTDRFIEDMVVRLSYAVIVVINDITLDEQIYLENLRKVIYTLRTQRIEKFDDLIVVHNFFREEKLSDARNNFEKQVEHNYAGTGKWQKKGTPFPYFYSKDKKDAIGMRHVYLAREPKGHNLTASQREVAEHNKRTIDLILSWMQSMAKDTCINIVDAIVKEGDELLKRYIENPGGLCFDAKRSRICVKDSPQPLSIKLPAKNKYLLPDTPNQYDVAPAPPRYDVLSNDDFVYIFMEVAGFTKEPTVRYTPDTHVVRIEGHKAKPKLYSSTTPRISRFFGPISVDIDLTKELPSCHALELQPYAIDKKTMVMKVTLKKVKEREATKAEEEEEYED